MYRITSFSNAEEFNEIFGITEHGNGVCSRKNKILLEFYKSKSVWAFAKKHDLYHRFFKIRTMSEMKSTIVRIMRKEMSDNSIKFTHRVELGDIVYWSGLYSTDQYLGIPTDGSVGFVRYVSHEKNREGKTYRCRAGKFYKRLLLETEIGQALPEQVIVWLCEQFNEEWSSYVSRLRPKYKLVVNDDFKSIYSNDCVCGDFHSCMMDDGQHIFYSDCVKAKAASLVSDEGIIARCVIFTEVKDEDGKVWRLAERQYSSGCSDLLKRCLVDALIAANEIDGYKQVGVDCHNNRAFVDVDGNSLHDKQFRIECNLEPSCDSDDAFDCDSNHVLSYQDSFRFYDMVDHVAYNYEPGDMYTNLLDMTDPYVYDNRKIDEYHGNVMCRRVNSVFYKGREIQCDSHRMEDFVGTQRGGFVHKDEVVKCPACGENMPDPKLYPTFSYEFNGKYYCCNSCCRDARRAWQREKCFYDDLRDQYVEKEGDHIINVLAFDFEGPVVRQTSYNYIKARIGRNAHITEDGYIFICLKSQINAARDVFKSNYKRKPNTFSMRLKNIKDGNMPIKNLVDDFLEMNNGEYKVDFSMEELMQQVVAEANNVNG